MKKLIMGLLFFTSYIIFASGNEHIIDLEKYSGKWYEIASFPSFFQRNCVSDTNAIYSINDDNSVKVINSCRDKKGNWIQSEGIAFSTNYLNNKLKVSFLPDKLNKISFLQADYWILAIDKEYKHVLVGTPNLKYLWILSRTQDLSKIQFEKYLEIAKNLGYDTSKLVKTIQNQYKETLIHDIYY